MKEKIVDAAHVLLLLVVYYSGLIATDTFWICIMLIGVMSKLTEIVNSLNSNCSRK